jgi:hypothetical protein
VRVARTVINRSHVRAAGALLLVAALLIPAVAVATTVPRTLEQLAASADAVVVARVTAISYRQTPSAGPDAEGAIVTDADLRLERALKGSRPDAFRLTVLGGESGGIAMVSSESPQLEVGDRFVLFLDATGRIMGGHQGALEVVGTDVPALGLTLNALQTRITGESGFSVLWTGGLAEALSASLTAAAPAITSISPPGQSAGTISAVTITGTGFGVARGVVRFHGTSASAPISSWTDTQVVCVVPVVVSGGTRVAASSGPVSLTTAAGASSTSDYRVGFAYAGYKWDTGLAPYTATGSVFYRVNTARAPSGALARVQAGAALWNTAAPSYFRFEAQGGGTGASLANDGVNTIFWSASGDPDPDVLARNQYWVRTSTGRIFDSDIIFYAGPRWGNGSGGTYDVATVAAHEMGHAVALLDQYGAGDGPGGANKLMYYLTTTGVAPFISADETAGVRYAYDPTYELPEPHLDVAPVVIPVGTAVTIGSSATRVRYPRPFVLSGVLRPGYVGDPVVAEVRKPGSARWSYSSARLCYSTASSGGANWWYRYTPRLRGTYYFRARYYGSTDRYGSLSRTISVRIVR